MIRTFHMLSLLASILVTYTLLLTVVSDVARAAPVPAPAASVSIGNFTFKAQVLTVRLGTTVTWTNADDIPHTVTSTTGAFKSKVLDSGDKFSFTFAKPGQFGYFCSLHPHMTGTVVVKA